MRVMIIIVMILIIIAATVPTVMCTAGAPFPALQPRVVIKWHHALWRAAWRLTCLETQIKSSEINQSHLSLRNATSSFQIFTLLLWGRRIRLAFYGRRVKVRHIGRRPPSQLMGLPSGMGLGLWLLQSRILWQVCSGSHMEGPDDPHACD